VHHSVKITDARGSCYLSNRYISDRFLPDKAIDLVDEAGSAENGNYPKPAELETIDRRLMQLEMEKLSLAGEDKHATTTRDRADGARDRHFEGKTAAI